MKHLWVCRREIFHKPNALPVIQQTVSKHSRQLFYHKYEMNHKSQARISWTSTWIILYTTVKHLHCGSTVMTWWRQRHTTRLWRHWQRDRFQSRNWRQTADVCATPAHTVTHFQLLLATRSGTELSRAKFSQSITNKNTANCFYIISKPNYQVSEKMRNNLPWWWLWQLRHRGIDILKWRSRPNSRHRFLTSNITINSNNDNHLMYIY